MTTGPTSSPRRRAPGSPQDVDSHEVRDEAQLPVPLLADVDKAVTNSYGVSAPVIGVRRSVCRRRGGVVTCDRKLIGATFVPVDKIVQCWSRSADGVRPRSATSTDEASPIATPAPLHARVLGVGRGRVRRPARGRRSAARARAADDGTHPRSTGRCRGTQRVPPSSAFRSCNLRRCRRYVPPRTIDTASPSPSASRCSRIRARGSSRGRCARAGRSASPRPRSPFSPVNGFACCRRGATFERCARTRARTAGALRVSPTSVRDHLEAAPAPLIPRYSSRPGGLRCASSPSRWLATTSTTSPSTRRNAASTST